MNAVCKKYNNSHLSGTNNKKLKPQTIQDAVDRGDIGTSPLKKGHPEKISARFTRALAMHLTMMQVAGEEGEASGQKIKTIVKVMTAGTKWNNKFSAEYA